MSSLINSARSHFTPTLCPLRRRQRTAGDTYKRWSLYHDTLARNNDTKTSDPRGRCVEESGMDKGSRPSPISRSAPYTERPRRRPERDRPHRAPNNSQPRDNIFLSSDPSSPLHSRMRRATLEWDIRIYHPRQKPNHPHTQHHTHHTTKQRAARQTTTLNCALRNLS
jgi:hypothetical protein